ncbi:MBL fold metallo-hydrolase [Vibrio navarrensis]|uniref:MBL fold metallo-hydrolase n=1 Tax=Vibrio navarrensis TaxID=29495 RepID=UPI0018667137|nr:MBL fold metallo-hydrolase [Vibrio navarrensis]MBE3666954.1 MBL fold metallo-hydrolase [Vibrio navarrensis]MBE4572317.1 MBL fold metallo-hydrolase [Vibrio navarrensis]MBE4577270.1 MBL fold metallo-hydrolase [Vibrio navarrensis]MBE4596181.1 MBL fold metallo-hydrolase [Vibrio navarrensis]MBE4600532.1 MBL fold metallo-hydrolase [Vibrio navarrensis]
MKTVMTLTATLLMSAGIMAKPLTLEVYNADGNSFHVNSTLVYGDTEAMVVDTGFTKADALRIAAKVLDSGKTLKTIFISQADPDYYFGAEVLKQLFPQAEVVATPAVRAKIAEKLQGKLAFWGPKMGANAPVNPLLPTAYQGKTLSLDGETIEIRDSEGELAHRPYLWIPANRAILGNVAVYGNVHLWMADAQSNQERHAWAEQLQQMAELKPQVVIPGHMTANTATDSSAIRFSQSYLTAFDQAKSNSKDSAMLIKTMLASYPDAGLPMALEIGAKVHTGEMKW